MTCFIHQGIVLFHADAIVPCHSGRSIVSGAYTIGSAPTTALSWEKLGHSSFLTVDIYHDVHSTIILGINNEEIL